MNTPVSFELAKLLKEKGYEQNIEVGTICRIQNTVNKDYEKTRPIKQSDIDNLWSIFNEVYPTIAEVVMWLYEKHGIWITSHPNHNFKYWSVNLVTNKAADLNLYDATVFNSPTEAYEAAIEYTLNNLI